LGTYERDGDPLGIGGFSNRPLVSRTQGYAGIAGTRCPGSSSSVMVI
jgi:hypothetical protein